MNGILLINKEKNRTSRDVVNDIVHIFNTKKVGHTGTLDPLATGVLVVTIGKYTKLCDILTSSYKEYIAEMQLGLLTDTLDITGNIISESVVTKNKEEIINIINSYQKKYIQEVPIYSAVKVNGKKLYEYARSGEAVSLPKKEVDIKEIEILSIENNVIRFRCLVSKGTYIRSLIRDIGISLGCNATMLQLIRTKQGNFNIKNAKTITEIKNNQYDLLTIEDALDVEIINDYEDIKHILNGVKIEYKSDKEYLLFKKDGIELALYKKDENIYRMFLLLKED